MTYAVTAEERAAFKRCRRAWDFGARTRRNLEPLDAEPPDRAIRDALAVHYFPGMWAWDRAIVRPLVLAAAGAAAPLIERYVDWAAGIDEFTPLRVETDFDAHVPDPRRPGHDLATSDGSAVRYRGRIDALVVDEDDRHWLLAHRIGPWSSAEALRLDRDAATDAWAWEDEHLDVQIRGILFNEITPEGRFRRSARRLSRFEVADAGTLLGLEASDIVSAELAVYPNPSPAHCPRCPFTAPCLDLIERGDAQAVLASSYRERATEEPVEGRLGGVTWSMGRGAAPPRFRGR